MLKNISLGLIAIILASSGLNGYAYLTQAYPNCEITIFSESESTPGISGDTTESKSESGGIGDMIGGLMPGGDGGGGGIGDMIGGGMPSIPGGAMPGGVIIPYAFGQEDEIVTDEQAEFAETYLEDALEGAEKQQARLDTAEGVGSGGIIGACDTPRTMKMVTLGLGVAGIAGIVFNFAFPIIHNIRLGAGSSGSFGNSKGSGGYTGSISEINTIIETEQKEGEKGIKINVKFKNKKKNSLFQVNYDIIANFSDQPILQENDVHSPNGELSHHTIDLPGEINYTNPLTIQVTFKGFGIKPPFSGPTGEKVSKTIPEPKTSSKEKKKIPIPKITIKTIIVMIVGIALIPGLMMSGIIPIQLDESTAAIQEDVKPPVTILDLETRMNVLEPYYPILLEKLETEIPGEEGKKGELGDAGIQGVVGEKGESNSVVLFLNYNSGENIIVSAPIFIQENKSGRTYDTSKILNQFDGTIRNLYVITDISPAIVVDVTLMKNGLETSLSCQLEKNTNCSNIKNHISINAGDHIALKLSKTGHAPSEPFIIQASMILELLDLT